MWAGNSCQGSSAMLRMLAAYFLSGIVLSVLARSFILVTAALLRLPGAAEHRLLRRHGRQLPGAGRGRADVGVDMDVDQRGLVERHGLRQHASKVLRARDGEGRHAPRPGPGREVGIVGLAVGAMIEGGADLSSAERRVGTEWGSQCRTRGST